MTLRVLIADDEADARAKLRRLLADHGDIVVVGEARNGRDAVRLVETTRPDVVLLDIRMPELDGFAAVRALVDAGTPLPKIVFVTAYDDYAVEAFEVRALDYLLKPYDGHRLGDALARVRAQLELEGRPSAPAVEALLAHLRDRVPAGDMDPIPAPAGAVDRLCIRSPGRVQFVDVAEVEWFEACGNYVRLHMAESRPLARATIRNLAAQLDPAGFVRIHRSAIVNVARIRELRPLAAGDSIVTLHSGTRLRVSRIYRPNLDQRLGRRSGPPETKT